MSSVVEQIRSRGYWDIAIYPEPYEKDRVDYGELVGLLSRNVVSLRGWPVPFVDHQAQIDRREDWIGQDIDASIVDHYEAWRFFTSGQFSQLRTISADWSSGRGGTTPANLDDPVIEVWEILFYLTEIYELAARLALGPAGDERMTIRVRLNNLLGRRLIMGVPRWLPLRNSPHSTMEYIERTQTLERDALVTTTRQLAAEMSRQFFVRFGWDAPLDTLGTLQAELREA